MTGPISTGWKPGRVLGGKPFGLLRHSRAAGRNRPAARCRYSLTTHASPSKRIICIDAIGWKLSGLFCNFRPGSSSGRS